MNPHHSDSIVNDEDGVYRLRVVPSAKWGYSFRLELPIDESEYLASVPLADVISSDADGFLDLFERFKLQESDQFLRRYTALLGKEAIQCALEIPRLTIESVGMCGKEAPMSAEITCCELPSTWRKWWCGFRDGAFHSLWY